MNIIWVKGKMTVLKYSLGVPCEENTTKQTKDLGYLHIGVLVLPDTRGAGLAFRLFSKWMVSSHCAVQNLSGGIQLFLQCSYTACVRYNILYISQKLGIYKLVWK